MIEIHPKFIFFQIIQSDSYPQNICYDCLTDLHHAFKFYENARSAEHQLSMQQEIMQLELKKHHEMSSTDDHEEQSKLYMIQSLGTDETEVEKDDECDENELMEVIPVMCKDEENAVHETMDMDGVTEEYIIEEDVDILQGNDQQPEELYQEETNNVVVEEYSVVPTRDNRLIRIYACEICSKTYDKKTSYQYHMKTKHTSEDDRQYQCSVCFKRFAVKGDFTRHSRIHTNEKRFSCSECGKKFTDRSTHLKHERMHTGVKPYQCDRCFKSFSYKFVLDNHYLTHTGEKNFICPECCRRFSRKAKMKDHFTRVHKRPFTDEDETQSKLMLEALLNDNNAAKDINSLSDEEFEVPVSEVDGETLKKIVESVSDQ